MRLGGSEITRGIYAAVRDRHWGTVPLRIENLQVESLPTSFRVSFEVDCRQAEIHFRWHGEISGAPDETVLFRLEGEAHSSFLSNRIGFCVLHPLAGCAGRECEVEHIDGACERGLFPQFISPHQPFKRMRAIRHQAQPGLRVEARFEGDVFEMEDQRNWTDASFKTYCTPLELPFPVRIEKGHRVSQQITVRLIKRGGQDEVPEGQRLSAASASKESSCSSQAPDLIIPDKPVLPLPPVGLGIASHGQPLTPSEVARLKLLRLSHLRVDLPFGDPQWPKILCRASQEANQLGCRLHPALFLTDRAEAELGSLLKELEKLHPPVALWMVFHVRELTTNQRWIDLAKAALERSCPGVPFAAGTNANFTELNRARLAPNSGVSPCFPINPQVHAIDNLSLMENIEAQPHAIATTRQFSCQPVVVSPVTLKPRFNAVATDDDSPFAPEQLPPAVDPRQPSLFAAAWTLGSIAALSGTDHVHSLTYYETTGWRGVIETERGSPLPAKFPSLPGSVFPIFHVLALLAGFNRFAPVTTSTPNDLAAIALFGEARRRILLANLSGDRRPLRIRINAGSLRLWTLDETNTEQAVRDPERFMKRPPESMRCQDNAVDLVLKAYAIACIELHE